MAENMIYKTFRVEVKDVDEENGIVDMLIPMSTGSVDRDGEVIEPGAWRKSLSAFKKRPILLSSHDYRDLRKQIGEFATLKLTDDGLFARPKYYINEGNEEADWAFNLATKKMAAYSVGFIPKKWEDGDGDKAPRRTYTENELLEISHIVIPSNRDAIQGLMAKGIQDPIVKDIADEVLNNFELITKPEETDDWIRIPVAECKVTATIDISKKEGIKALYCGKEKKVRTYMFDKRPPYNWTMAKAKKWVEDHKESKQEVYKCECVECGHKVESEKHCQDIKCPKCGGKMRRVGRPGPGKEEIEIEEKVISQAGVKDEVDYLRGVIEDVGLNEEAMEDAWELVRDIMRLAGDDIPDDIRDTIGATITEQQELKVRDAIKYLEEYLAKTDVPEQVPKSEEPKEDKKEAEMPSMQEIAKMVAGAVKDEIDRLRGKVS